MGMAGERPEKYVEGIGPLAMMLMNGSNQMLTLVMTGISNCDWQALHAATPQGRRLAPYPVVGNVGLYSFGLFNPHVCVGLVFLFFCFLKKNILPASFWGFESRKS